MVIISTLLDRSAIIDVTVRDSAFQESLRSYRSRRHSDMKTTVLTKQLQHSPWLQFLNYFFFIFITVYGYKFGRFEYFFT